MDFDVPEVKEEEFDPNAPCSPSTDWMELLEECEDRKTITEFSWDVGIGQFDQIMGCKRKSEEYFLDGESISDEEYLEVFTSEICREYGLSVLGVVSDLVFPFGYRYPSLIKGLPELLDDALKPVSKIGLMKTIVWVEDEYWKESDSSITELLIRRLCLSKIEPFLLAPEKYFDKELFAEISKAFQNSILNEESMDTTTSPESKLDFSWNVFSSLVKFSFLLAFRSTSTPIIVLHFSNTVAERINTFQLIDLAQSEGHKVRYLKNLKEFTHAERLAAVDKTVGYVAQDLKHTHFHQGNAVGNAFLVAGHENFTEDEDEVMIPAKLFIEPMIF